MAEDGPEPGLHAGAAGAAALAPIAEVRPHAVSYECTRGKGMQHRYTGKYGHQGQPPEEEGRVEGEESKFQSLIAPFLYLQVTQLSWWN